MDGDLPGHGIFVQIEGIGDSSDDCGIMTTLPENIDVRFCPEFPVDSMKPVIPRNIVEGNRLTFGRIEDSIKNDGVVEPFLVKNEESGMMIEVGNHRYVLVKKLGITHVPCIINTILPRTPPEGERMLTMEDVMGKLTYAPMHVSLAEWGVNLHPYNFTVEQSVPREWAKLSGRANCREEWFGRSGNHLRLVIETKGLGFSHGVWSDWMVAEGPVIACLLQGSLHLLRGGPPNWSATQVLLQEMEFERIDAGTRFSFRAYASPRSAVPGVNSVLLGGPTNVSVVQGT